MKKVLAFSLMMMTLVVTGCATAPNTATHSGGTDWISTVEGSINAFKRAIPRAGSMSEQDVGIAAKACGNYARSHSANAVPGSRSVVTLDELVIEVTPGGCFVTNRTATAAPSN